MKILHIELNEHDSLDELKAAFKHDVELPEMPMPNAKLVSSKKQAEKTLMANTKSRVFWYSKFRFNGTIGFLMHECLVD